MSYKYDVAISFAGEHRQIAEKLASTLKKLNICVFYDKDKTSDTWGQNLYQGFSNIYRDEARYCVVLISKEYIEKDWTKHELEQIQARAFKEPGYLLPVRLDSTEVPGLNCTTGYIDLNQIGIEDIVKLIIEKLSKTSTCWRLFTFLRDTNPRVLEQLENKANLLRLMVSSSRETQLNRIMKLSDITEYALIQPTGSTFSGGGGNRTYNICDEAGDPLVGYCVTLTQNFFNSISL